jgi:hypothetical protein
MLACQVILTKNHEAAIRMLEDWGFKNVNGGLEFEGSFIGAERLRFLTSISHFGNQDLSLKVVLLVPND